MRLVIDLSRSRVETKYSITAVQVPALTSRIPADHREAYGVVTNYFDRPDGSLARSAIEDPLHCTKVRTRQYPEDSSVWFEVKTRRGRWTRKSRLQLSRSEATRLVHGISPNEVDASGLLRVRVGDPKAEAKLYLGELARGGLVPVGAVYAYRRTFLVSPDQVRITLDQEISYYRPSENPYAAEGAMAPELLLRSERGLVLEVKHRGTLPPWCRLVLAGLRRSKYSKFRNLVLTLAESRRAANRVDRL